MSAWDELAGKKVAAALYNDKEDSAAQAALRLRAELEKYYREEADPGEIRFFLRPRVWYLEIDQTVRVSPIRRSPIFEKRESNHNISLTEFRQFLEQLCDLEGTSKEDKDLKARNWWESTAPYSSGPELPSVGEFDAVFSELGKMSSGLTFSEMRGLSHEMGIHPIMLDPLLSDEIETDCISLLLPGTGDAELSLLPNSCQQGHFEEANKPEEGNYGYNARYHIPDIKLAKTDASFVYLVLTRDRQPNGQDGHSDAHHHPGDELLFVLKGCVEVRFPDSGNRVKLEAGSYIHFYAEQNHSAHYMSSESEEAHILIVRLYQRRPLPNTRQQMRTELWNRLIEPGTFECADGLLSGWILEAAATRSLKQTDEIPEAILNKSGLARFLSFLPKPGAAAEQRFLETISEADKPYASIADWLDRLARGQVKLSISSIPQLHKLYEAFDLLIWDFLFPGVLRQVAVSRKNPGKGDWADLLEVLRVAHAKRTLPLEVRYEVPRRSLACSDLTISWVTIQPNKYTPRNRHAGCEVLIPIKGEITLVFEGPGEVCKLVAGKNIAHYASGKYHRARNSGSQTAEMAVLRFFTETRERDGR